VTLSPRPDPSAGADTRADPMAGAETQAELPDDGVDRFAETPAGPDTVIELPNAPDGLAGLPAGRVTEDREPTGAEVEEAATVVEGALAGSRNKADRATRGVLSALVALEALVVLLVPRAIAQTDTGLNTTKTVILIVLAVVLLMTAFLMRRRWAVGLGSVLQVAVLATGVLEWVMVVVALVFIGLWVWVLTMRRDWVRTPGGLRMLVS
jgi:Protein of unknown function (DUF4233)